MSAARSARSVCHAYVHSEEVAHSWHVSLKTTIEFDRQNDGVLGAWIASAYGTEGLPGARNETVQGMLSTDAEWLWWTDVDMGWQPDALYKLLESADPDFAPVVGGLCFVWKEVGLDGYGGRRHQAAPTLFDWRINPDGTYGFLIRKTVPRRGGLVQVSGTGAAFILIHRSVLEKIRDNIGPVWYSRLSNPTTGQLIAEDLSFCARCANLKIPVHVNLDVITNHKKTVWVGPEDAVYEG